MTARTVLSVAQNPLSTSLLRAALEDHEYTVIEATDRSSALAALALRRPDVVVVGGELPETERSELLGELRRRVGAEGLSTTVVRGAGAPIGMSALDCHGEQLGAEPVDSVLLREVVRPQVRPDGSKDAGIKVLVIGSLTSEGQEQIGGSALAEARPRLERSEEQLRLQHEANEDHRLAAHSLETQRMESVGSFAAGIAHDLNTLLCVILGYAEVLADRLTGPAERQNLEEICKAGERAVELTGQLLALGRSQVRRPQAVDLNVVIVGVEPLLRRLVGDRIELVTTLSADAGRALVDAGELQRVLVNLVVNARDAMPAGGRLSVETARVELDAAYAAVHSNARVGQHVMIALSDSGDGIDLQTRAHIFEPFFTTKEEGKGSGLGLANVYGIVEQSGGHIDVASESGRGTTFRIYLPRVDAGVASPVGAAVAARLAMEGSETVT